MFYLAAVVCEFKTVFVCDTGCCVGFFTGYGTDNADANDIVALAIFVELGAAAIALVAIF